MTTCYAYHDLHRAFTAMRCPHNRAAFPAGTMAPGAVPRAYGFLSNQGQPKRTTIYGIGSLGGNVSGNDVRAFCSAGGFPVPSLTVLAVGGVTITSDPGGANVENQLDIQRILEVWNTAFPGVPASIVVGIGPNVGNGIATVTTALRQAGADVINWSWGAPESQWAPSDRAVTETEFAACRAAGVIVCAASGDNSLDDGTRSRSCDYPCGSAYVWAVGGTNLQLAPDGTRAGESAWGDGRPGDEGGGGGFDALTPRPSWQVGVVPNTGRGCPDSCLNADPASGYQTAYDGTWGVVGGTSASSPATAGYLGVLLALGASPANLQAWLYAARKTAFNDITTGSNGDPAAPGWDDATGLGSINGPGLAAALLTTTTPPVTRPILPRPRNPRPRSLP